MSLYEYFTSYPKRVTASINVIRSACHQTQRVPFTYVFLPHSKQKILAYFKILIF